MARPSNRPNRPNRPERTGEPKRERQRLHGTHCVLEALRARRRRLDRVLVREGWRHPKLEAIAQAAAEARVGIETVSADEIGAVPGPGGSAAGVAIEAGPLPELGLEVVSALSGSNRTVVALDGVEDPQNVGAIARVAEAAGAGALILTRRRSPPLGPALARASAGAIEWLPVVRVTNLGRALKDLKNQGFWVVGADPSAPVSVFEADDRMLLGDSVLLLGAEGRGLRTGARAAVDHPVRIPMPGRIDSLNVSTAGAVILFEMLRRAHTDTDRTESR